MQRALRKRMVPRSTQRTIQGRVSMPDKFGWCSVERDGQPKHRGWHLVTNRSDVIMAGNCAWSTRFWSNRNWDGNNDPRFYLLCPGKEAFEPSPKPKPCPICGGEPELRVRSFSHFVRCGKIGEISVGNTCLIGPDANNERTAIALWNKLRCE